MQPTGVVLISEEDVKKHLTSADAVRLVEEVFRFHGRRQVVMPAKITLNMPTERAHNWMNAMPGYLPELGVAGIKWAGGFVRNAELGLPYVMGTVILNSPLTGEVQAIISAGALTTIRTGAAAAVAVRYLAHPDSKAVAFIGAGAQCRSSLRAIACLPEFSFSTVRVYDRLPEASRQFVAELAEVYKAEYVVCHSPQEAVTGADVVVVATTANEPLVAREWVHDTACVVKLGSYQELDDKLTLGAGRLVVDDWGQSLHRGELVHLLERGAISRDNVYGELGDIVAGRLPKGFSEGGPNVACLLGMATQDLAVGLHVYRQVLAAGQAQTFDFKVRG